MILDYFYGQAGELFSFYRIPKALFQEPRFQSLSTDAKTLYGILLDRMSLSVKNGWLDEQNRVFILFTIPDHAHRRIKAPQRIPVGIKYSAIPMAFDGIRMAPNRCLKNAQITQSRAAHRNCGAARLFYNAVTPLQP